MTVFDKQQAVLKAATLLVQHFSDCQQRGNKGLHSRVFSYFLHPEADYVGVGRSKKLVPTESAHPEHVVPCAVMIDECLQLLKAGVAHTDIAELLAKHWKIVFITKDEARYLDSANGVNLKKCMPKDWCFQTGDSFARLQVAGIEFHYNE